MWIRTLACLALFTAAPATAEDRIVGGPMAVNVTSNSATIVWVVTDQEVRLGSFPNVYTKAAPDLRAESVGFTGLDAGKTYHYQVPGHDVTGHFNTAPKGPAAFEFIVYGDTRTRHDLHQKIVNTLVRDTSPDFMIHTGDLVSNGADTGQWPVFFGIEDQLLRQTVFFPALGNHERNSRHFYEFFAVTTPYYSFDWGSAHFTILNSDYGNAAASKEMKDRFWADQLRWLEEDLRASQEADFRFVVMHHPPFTAVKRRQGGNKPVADMVPLFEKYNVTAVYNGHDHNYQHHLNNGVHYIVTGGGGAPLYPVDGPLEGITKKVESTEHYVVVRVDGNKAVSEAIALDGHVIERLELP